MELIAHRAGNSVSTIDRAAAVADSIEVDVHLHLGRLEVRHAKILLWPFSRLWERWELLPADAPRPAFGEILADVPDDVRLWIDLKGFTSRLPRAVVGVLGERPGTTWSARQWWVLRWVRATSDDRTMKSVGSRWQRWLVARTGVVDDAHGIVVHERLVDDVWLERFRRITPNVVVWGVRDAARAEELRRAGVSGLILDDLGLIGALSER